MVTLSHEHLGFMQGSESPLMEILGNRITNTIGSRTLRECEGIEKRAEYDVSALLLLGSGLYPGTAFTFMVTFAGTEQTVGLGVSHAL